MQPYNHTQRIQDDGWEHAETAHAVPSPEHSHIFTAAVILQLPGILLGLSSLRDTHSIYPAYLAPGEAQADLQILFFLFSFLNYT